MTRDSIDVEFTVVEIVDVGPDPAEIQKRRDAQRAAEMKALIAQLFSLDGFRDPPGRHRWHD